jgi:hypothetical protein
VDAQQVVDDLKALRPLGIVDAANVDQRPEVATRVVAQEAQQAEQRIGRRPQNQLAEDDLALRH